MAIDRFALGSNIAAAERERQRRQQLLNEGAISPQEAAQSAYSGSLGWDSFFGGLHDTEDAANAAGMNFRMNTNAIGNAMPSRASQRSAPSAGSLGYGAGDDGVDEQSFALNEYLARESERRKQKAEAEDQANRNAMMTAYQQQVLNSALAPPMPSQTVTQTAGAGPAVPYGGQFGASVAPATVTKGANYTIRPQEGETEQQRALSIIGGPQRLQLQDLYNKQNLAEREIGVKETNAATAAAAAGIGPGGTSLMEEYTAEPPDPKKANIVDPRTGRTPNALWQDALTYGMEGKLPTTGLSSKGPGANYKAAIQNKAGAIAQVAGVDLPTVHAEYKANSAALNKILPQYTTLSAYSDTANRNIQLALDQSAKVPRTGSPIVNRFEQWALGHTLTGDPQLTKLENYIYSAAREYAKVTSGSFMSAAELSQGAAKKADELINASQTPDAFQAATQAMQDDMNNVTAPWLKQVNGVSGSIARLLATAHGQPVPTGTAPPPSAAGGAAGGGGTSLIGGTVGKPETPEERFKRLSSGGR